MFSLQDLVPFVFTFLVALLTGWWLGRGGLRKERKHGVIFDKDAQHVLDEPLAQRRREQKESKSSSGRRRLIIVAKQLPIKASRSDKGEWTIQWDDARSFLSGLRVLQKSCEVKFVGSPGVFVPRDEQSEFETLLEKHDCVPVYLSEDLQDRFFNGFCKTVLWPVLHYVMPSAHLGFAKRWDTQWQAYQSANMLYAKEVARVAESAHDSIWVHNYHCLLVPSFLRKKLPRARIGLFLHTPFPSSDVFRVLPARENLLRGIMCSDLIGFHTYDYARHFLSCTKRVLDLDYEALPGGAMGIKYSGRYVSILISHVGIESHVFQKAAASAEAQQRAEELRKKYGARKIIVGVDDFDLAKGSVLKLQAFERFLASHPEWRDKIALVQIMLPSSATKEDKKTCRDAVLSEVSSIRTQFGTEVIEVIERETIDFIELVSLYLAAQVAFMSTFWDGLNVAPYEFTASQNNEDPAALVLSEFMGCSRSLSGVIRVNPWSLEHVSDAIHQALAMSLEERKANHAPRYAYVMSHTIARWADSFLEHLDDATKLAEDLIFAQVGWGSNVRLVGLRADFIHADENALTNAYRVCPIRIILLDYDGTLTPSDKDALIKQKIQGPSSKVKKALKSLCEDPSNVVFIIAGRQRKKLIQFFGDIPELGLAAEKGCFIRWPASRQHLYRAAPLIRTRSTSSAVAPPKLHEHKGESKEAPSVVPSTAPLHTHAHLPVSQSTPSGLGAHHGTAAEDERIENDQWDLLAPHLDDLTWKEIALEVIREYTEHTDGSWIEDKEFAIVWHFADSDPEYGRMQASELVKYLIKVLDHLDIDVVKYDYNRIVEVKPRGISKGRAATHILRTVLGKAKAQGQNVQQPFLMCIGDDLSDEEMFRAVQKRDDLLPEAKAPTAQPLVSRKLPSEELSTTTSQAERDKKFDPNTFTLCVGIKPSSARMYLHDHEDVAKLLQALATCSERSKRRTTGNAGLAALLSGGADSQAPVVAQQPLNAASLRTISPAELKASSAAGYQPSSSSQQQPQQQPQGTKLRDSSSSGSISTQQQQSQPQESKRDTTGSGSTSGLGLTSGRSQLSAGRKAKIAVRQSAGSGSDNENSDPEDEGGEEDSSVGGLVKRGGNSGNSKGRSGGAGAGAGKESFTNLAALAS